LVFRQDEANLKTRPVANLPIITPANRAVKDYFDGSRPLFWVKTLGYDVVDHITGDIGQPEIAPAIAVGQLSVVDAH
jgi:hypothetical protein